MSCCELDIIPLHLRNTTTNTVAYLNRLFQSVNSLFHDTGHCLFFHFSLHHHFDILVVYTSRVRQYCSLYCFLSALRLFPVHTYTISMGTLHFLCLVGLLLHALHHPSHCLGSVCLAE
jgi:hypothetical protein